MYKTRESILVSQSRTLVHLQQYQTNRSMTEKDREKKGGMKQALERKQEEWQAREGGDEETVRRDL